MVSEIMFCQAVTAIVDLALNVRYLSQSKGEQVWPSGKALGW